MNGPGRRRRAWLRAKCQLRLIAPPERAADLLHRPELLDVHRESGFARSSLNWGWATISARLSSRTDRVDFFSHRASSKRQTLTLRLVDRLFCCATLSIRWIYPRSRSGPPRPGGCVLAREKEARVNFRDLLKRLGPGFVTGASDDDPAAMGTNVQTGAQFAYGQLWTTLFSFPLMAAVQEMCGRIGLVT